MPLGQLAVGGIALWIVTIDRRQFDQLRQEEQRAAIDEFKEAVIENW